MGDVSGRRRCRLGLVARRGSTVPVRVSVQGPARRQRRDWIFRKPLSRRHHHPSVRTGLFFQFAGQPGAGARPHHPHRPGDPHRHPGRAAPARDHIRGPRTRGGRHRGRDAADRLLLMGHAPGPAAAADVRAHHVVGAPAGLGGDGAGRRGMASHRPRSQTPAGAPRHGLFEPGHAAAPGRAGSRGDRGDLGGEPARGPALSEPPRSGSPGQCLGRETRPRSRIRSGSRPCREYRSAGRSAVRQKKE